MRQLPVSWSVVRAGQRESHGTPLPRLGEVMWRDVRVESHAGEDQAGHGLLVVGGEKESAVKDKVATAASGGWLEVPPLVAAVEGKELLARLQADSFMMTGIQAEPLSLKLRALRWREESPRAHRVKALDDAAQGLCVI